MNGSDVGGPWKNPKANFWGTPWCIPDPFREDGGAEGLDIYLFVKMRGWRVLLEGGSIRDYMGGNPLLAEGNRSNMKEWRPGVRLLPASDNLKGSNSRMPFASPGGGRGPGCAPALGQGRGGRDAGGRTGRPR